MDEYIPGFENPDDEDSGYFSDDGIRLYPDCVPRPGLCLLCVNDDNPHELVLCNLTRLGQAEDGAGDFECGAFRPKKV